MSEYQNEYQNEYPVKCDYRPLTLSPSTAMEPLIIIKVGNFQSLLSFCLGAFGECFNCVQKFHI